MAVVHGISCRSMLADKLWVHFIRAHSQNNCVHTSPFFTFLILLSVSPMGFLPLEAYLGYVPQRGCCINLNTAMLDGISFSVAWEESFMLYCVKHPTSVMWAYRHFSHFSRSKGYVCAGAWSCRGLSPMDLSTAPNRHVGKIWSLTRIFISTTFRHLTNARGAT